MPVIKRYANRKLYDTAAKRYVTLDGIAELIRQGEDVRVTDHETGADLTAQIQAQIIFEQEKKARGGLPHNVFTDLIQAGNDTLSQLRHALARGGDASAHVDAEIQRRIEALIQHGQLAAAEGLRLRDLLFQAAHLPHDPAWPTQADLGRLAQVLGERGVPSRTELRRLAQQLDSLADEVERLTQLGNDQPPAGENV